MNRIPSACSHLPGLLLAALLTVRAEAEAPRIFAITDVRIVTAPGRVIERGTVVLRDGLIESVGTNVVVPPDAWKIATEAGWKILQHHSSAMPEG